MKYKAKHSTLAKISGRTGENAVFPVPPSSGGKAAGKYDRLRLEHLKNEDDYNATKRQFLDAYRGGRADQAILIALRGADSPVAPPPGSPPQRLRPQKVFQDLLLGFDGKELEVYAVDKELEGAVVALRRAIPAFWGRRAAKALAVEQQKSVALEPLARVMASTGTWVSAWPNFYELALLPVRLADGDTEAAVHASFGYTPGTDPYANASVLHAISELTVALLADLGVHGSSTGFDMALASAADVRSTQDVFDLLSHVHARLGSLPTTAATLSDLFKGLLGDWGASRASVRASGDAQRALDSRFVEVASVRVVDFFKNKGEQTAGRYTAAQMRAAGFVTTTVGSVSNVAQPQQTLPQPVLAAPGGVKRDSPEFKAAVAKEARKLAKQAGDAKQGGEAALRADDEEVPPVVFTVQADGSRVHIAGGKRGPSGCYYLVTGPNGV